MPCVVDSGGHATHAPSSVAPLDALNVFGGHASHAAVPANDLKCPGWHGLQAWHTLALHS
eukprot:3600312-Rhodomonas_salina.1